MEAARASAIERRGDLNCRRGGLFDRQRVGAELSSRRGAGRQVEYGSKRTLERAAPIDVRHLLS
jgi:hypothetical protein